MPMNHGILTLTNLVVIAIKSILPCLNLGTGCHHITLYVQGQHLVFAVDGGQIKVIAVVGTKQIQVWI